jgi:hypothetical protein
MLLMAAIASVVDTHALLQTIWVALAAGIGITVAFSFALVGVIRAQEARQGGNAVRMPLYGALGTVGMAAVGAGIVLGLIAMAQK